MKNRFLRLVSSLAWALAATTASAQSNYAEGSLSYTTNVAGQSVNVKEYFNTTAAATISRIGPYNFTELQDDASKTFVVLLQADGTNIKKAAIATPDEVAKMFDGLPAFSFQATSESRQISGYRCQQVIATDTKTGATYEVWITHDISIPRVAIPAPYKDAGGLPVQFVLFGGGFGLVTISAVTNDKPPSGTFDIPDDFDRISFDELRVFMQGR